MRAGVWCVAALVLVAAASALRPSQVESTRNGRRLSSSGDSRGQTSTVKSEDAQPTFRSRSPRRREEPTSSTPRDIVRSRSRSKLTDTVASNTVAEQQSVSENIRTERYDSRRTNRLRSRPSESEINVAPTYPSRDISVKNKVRQSNRRTIYTTTEAAITSSSSAVNDSKIIRRAQTTSTEQTLKLSSPILDDMITEVTYANFDDFTRTVPKEEDINAVQFRRRSSTARTIEIETSKPTRSRGRINTRPSIKLEDMASSGATNVLAISEKNPSDEKSSKDSKTSRKLRYRTRFSETDTNLTGEGITASNEIVKSVSKKPTFTSQTESRTQSLAPIDKTSQNIVESNRSKSSTLKTMRVVRRPLLRNKDNATTPSKAKSPEEISEDDNYPETFKALIQAKNASTQVSSPPSESLSVKETHKVISVYTQTTLPSNTSPETNSNTRLRSKLNRTENDSKKEDVNVVESFSNSTSSKSNEYRLRGTYSPRSRKNNAFNAATVQKITTANPVSVKSPYKFTRKLKTTTTELPLDRSSKTKRFEPGQASQKTVVRSSYFPRKNNTKSSEKLDNDENVHNNETKNNVNTRVKLPRTSYYARLRKNLKNDVTTDKIITVTAETSIADKKVENTADMPLIYTLLSRPAKNIITKTAKEEIKGNDKDEFLIAVSSKDSQENNVDNEIVNNAEESENKPVVNVYSTTQKYHANYKVQTLLNETTKKDFVANAATPSIRNIQTRKYGRKLIRSKDRAESTSQNPVTKSNERTLRKYSDTFSKTTEASTNGITSDPEKPKSRFSSKYRASYLDKPFYKPTVPTVTPTTVVGEEIELGQDMNAISITQTRSTLSSADLRLSESLVKPSHVMNVEASNHSPSVTVSIFDALAEILTSTPRVQISTTTEVPKQIYTDSVTKQTLTSVSSNNNVNNVDDLTSQGTSMSTDSINTNTPVQITDQTTPIVLNRLSEGESVSPSLNTEKMEFSSTYVPQTTFTPTPTTPISARKPFAIKVLYSDTEPPTDILMTSSESTTNWSTTENPKMVYNTVSDLILSNNKLVSSELTSMLTNNIDNIMRNLDEESRSRISVDMVNLLKTLIPRAMNKLPLTDVDNVPNTTPYSLEDIKDTENIDIGNVDVSKNESFNLENKNLLQNVLDTDVNITQGTTVLSVKESTTDKFVNIPSISQHIFSTTSTVLESEATEADILTTTESISTSSRTRSFDLSTVSTVDTTPLITSGINIGLFDTATLPDLNTGTTSVDSTTIITPTIPVTDPLTDPTNKPLTVPFSANANIDFTSNGRSNMSSSIIKIDNQGQDIDNIDIEDPSQISRLQLWVLSKKARILKMIEQLIKQHNDEIANAPLTDLVDRPNEDTFLSRLTDINSTMNLTTTSNDGKNDVISLDNDSEVRTESVVSSTPPQLLDLFTTETLSNRFRSDVTVFPMTVTNDMFASLLTTEVASTIGDATEAILSQTTNEIAGALNSTEVIGVEVTTVEKLTESQDLLENNPTATENESNEVTTMKNLETTTETSFTTEGIVETTTQAGIETTTVTITNETKLSEDITITSQVNIASQTIIPKKDYVIFGILPNNTVVRKDPNDNLLEAITEASPYIVYGVLPNNTVIRKFPNGTRVPRIMQKIDVLPISPWSLRNPYSPIHNNPAIVRPQSNPIRVFTNIVTSTNNGTENRLTTDTVNNQQMMISSSTLNLKGSSSLGITTTTTKPSAEKSTASHVLSLRTTTMLPSIHEILLNSLSSATKEEMVISSMTSSTREPRILTLDIDPETKQIRTEKPSDGKGNAVFKFIPIDQVTIPPQDTNVLKLASTKATYKSNTEKEVQIVTPMSVTEVNSVISQIQTRLENLDEPTTTVKSRIGTPNEMISENNNDQFSNILTTNLTPTATTFEPTTESVIYTLRPTVPSTTVESNKITTTIQEVTSTQTTTTIGNAETFSTLQPSTSPFTTTDFGRTVETLPKTTSPTESRLTTTRTDTQSQNDVNLDRLLSPLVTEEAVSTSEQPRFISGMQNTKIKNQNDLNILQNLLAILSTTVKPNTLQEVEQMKLLQALLSATGQNPLNNLKVSTTTQAPTSRSLQDELRQFEEDTKLLKALLQATGQNSLELPIKNGVKTTVTLPTTTTPVTTTVSQSTRLPTTMITTASTTSLADEVAKLKEETELLKALLQTTGQNTGNGNLPIISGITSNVRIASNPLTTSFASNPTTPISIRPVYTTLSPTEKTSTQSEILQNIALQEQLSTVTEDIGISTTFRPVESRTPTSTKIPEILPGLSARRAPLSTQATTEFPSTSTFSVEEDLEFLNNLKNVLNTNNNNNDPEAALANRVIALAVERSLSEIQTGKQTEPMRNGKSNEGNFDRSIRTTTKRPTTTTRMTTTTTIPPTVRTQITPSIEEDIKQFEEDTKLLQALLKATGQDPSKFNIPTLPNVNNINNSNRVKDVPTSNPTTAKPFNGKIAVKDNLKNVQDDAQLLQTLIKLKDAQETTTQRNKLAITGQSSDEALQKLIQQAKPTVMISEATKPSVSLSTEYGNSNDALLAALLKEQGFGPTTASSLDEQVRLAALLNQVVVTPKARRTTTLPPPPPAPRRPILDGLAWLWQQWRDTAPGTGGSPGTRTNRKPAPTSRPSAPPAATAPARVNWFGSGPFVGNADDRPTSNRIPLEPPRAVAAEQAPGRGQLVSAAINVTRAFSQFLGAAIQGAAQTVQNVIRAGQKAATDVYTNGSG
ncbi:serine-rich adhesin for platelets-like [Battus philenor]|uniref:serine-rich adhesin for platelets-like n=1 Tax=Battus philenor TaxID=42288 RepID=UPI0035D125FB